MHLADVKKKRRSSTPTSNSKPGAAGGKGENALPEKMQKDFVTWLLKDKGITTVPAADR